MVAARPRRGFSLLEVSVSSLLVGILLIGSMKTVGTLVLRSGTRAQQDLKLALAHNLLSEIQHALYEDPDSPTASLGPDSGEDPANRQDFDDLDDYDDWSETVVRDREGNAIEGYSGYQRSVQVDYVEALKPDSVSDHATDLKRITIHVVGPDGTTATIKSLRGRYSPADTLPGLRATYVRSVRVRIGMETASSAVDSGSGVLNQIAVEGPL